jgi:hypothetical protein
MRESRDPSGRMPSRLWYEESEIDLIMDDAFKAAGCPRLSDAGAVDVDAFIELHLKITPEYVTLPDGVFGASDFHPNGKVKMRISDVLSQRAADQEPGAEHFIRTTMAHEAAHVLLHRSMFLSQTESLFGTPAPQTELCRDVGPVLGYSGEWWEWQANRGMGALLMPYIDMRRLLRSNRSEIESAEPAFVDHIAHAYSVSTQVVRYRFSQVLDKPRLSRQTSWEIG